MHSYKVFPSPFSVDLKLKQVKSKLPSCLQKGVGFFSSSLSHLQPVKQPEREHLPEKVEWEIH